MRLILTLVLTMNLVSCSTNRLDEKTQTIELAYIAWGCDCANWATVDDIKKYQDAGDTLADLSIFIEPANDSLKLPDSVSYNMSVVKFTGQFYKSKGFPKDFSSNEWPDKARVFRYTNFEIVKLPNDN